MDFCLKKKVSRKVVMADIKSMRYTELIISCLRGFLFFCFVQAKFIYISTTIIDWIFNEAIGIIRYYLISLDIKKRT